jgi:hypothetical protein
LHVSMKLRMESWCFTISSFATCTGSEVPHR